MTDAEQITQIQMTLSLNYQSFNMCNLFLKPNRAKNICRPPHTRAYMTNANHP